MVDLTGGTSRTRMLPWPSIPMSFTAEPARFPSPSMDKVSRTLSSCQFIPVKPNTVVRIQCRIPDRGHRHRQRSTLCASWTPTRMLLRSHRRYAGHHSVASATKHDSKPGRTQISCC